MSPTSVPTGSPFEKGPSPLPLIVTDSAYAKLFSAAQDQIARRAKLTRTTVLVSVAALSGTWTRLDQIRSYDPKTCIGTAPYPTGMIDPLRGRIEIRKTEATFATKECGQITGPAYEVYYYAFADFTGPDIMSYVLADLEQTTVVSITVVRAGPVGK